MVTKRSVATAIIFTFITCGIYGIYWFICLTNDVGTLSGDDRFTGGKHFLLTLVTCGIWGYVWCYQLGKHIQEAQMRSGYPASDNSVLFIILNLFGLSIVTYGIAQADVNKLV
ncbi:DUF4234 domain-containing protein [Gorillibacterium massiliense]|uniref:DUF4234 domain-containing protein n=1 Tax=Gorillibacterium massiliense TaxID=1280390 RepID=UPI0004AD6611|nr:DUF4234 domain-containing protein [Gorillibacterium massiliense]